MSLLVYKDSMEFVIDKLLPVTSVTFRLPASPTATRDGRATPTAAEARAWATRNNLKEMKLPFSCFLPTYLIVSLLPAIHSNHLGHNSLDSLTNVELRNASNLNVSQIMIEHESEESHLQIVRQLRLRTAVTTVLSGLIIPFRSVIVLAASTYAHAMLFRTLLPPIITALKSSELCDIDLSPDAVTRNAADFAMDYVCEVIRAWISSFLESVLAVVSNNN